MREQTSYLLILIFTFERISTGQSLQCLHCDSITHPRYCQVVTTCNPGEVCYARTVEASDGLKSYQVGCTYDKNRAVCNTTATGSDSFHCLECCGTDLCNAGLCGQQGYPAQKGPVCYSCKSRLRREPCNAIQFCGLDEVCSITQTVVFSEFLYSRGCSQKHSCEAHYHGNTPQIVGKRDTEDDLAPGSCHRCCDTDLCNVNCTTTTTTTTTNIDACVSTPCRNGGTCVNTADGFNCRCPARFTGKTCDTKRLECTSNPCQNGGTCQEMGTDFTCTCLSGFAGTRCEKEAVHPEDCLAVQTLGLGNITGVYTITLPGLNKTLPVLCDMTTDGGGWTVFQHRFNGSVDFNRNFSEYENGFGDIHGEFWLGLKYIYELTAHCLDVVLRIDLEDAAGTTAYEVFQNFSVSAGPAYTLHIDRGNGTAGDELYQSNGKAFATYDHDNTDNCVYNTHNPWWQTLCSNANLNAHYLHPPGGRLYINTWERGFFYYKFDDVRSLKASKLQLRRTGGRRC